MKEKENNLKRHKLNLGFRSLNSIIRLSCSMRSLQSLNEKELSQMLLIQVKLKAFKIIILSFYCPDATYCEQCFEGQSGFCLAISVEGQLAAVLAQNVDDSGQVFEKVALLSKAFIGVSSWLRFDQADRLDKTAVSQFWNQHRLPFFSLGVISQRNCTCNL